MHVFVDTSAIYSLLASVDIHHEDSHAIWRRLVDQRQRLITSNYVIVETLAVAGRRLGIQAARDFQRELLPAFQIFWVDESLHRRAMSALLAAGLRDLSLVDCTSFEIMHDLNLTHAFAFDAHFVQQGFVCLN